MTTTQMDIKDWFDEGKKDGATHMIIVCDQFNHEDYPAYVSPDENVHDTLTYYRMSPMQTIMEVYDLHMDRDKQLSTPRVYNYPPFPDDYQYTAEMPPTLTDD